jgi:hypothetical protein
MYLESKTTELVDSLEVASIKFLNSVSERRVETQRQLSPSQVAAQTTPPPIRATRA